MVTHTLDVVILMCKSPLIRSVRQMAQEQFFLMATRCCMGHRPLLFFITLLFTVLGVSGHADGGSMSSIPVRASPSLMSPHHVCVQSTAKERAKHAGDYFTLLRHLLNYAYNSNINLPNAEVLLNNEIDWLKRIRVKSIFSLLPLGTSGLVL